MIPKPPACVRVEQDYRQGHPHKRKREDTRDAPVEGRLVLLVDDPGERWVPHQRHGAEVAQRVQRHEQRPGDDRGTQLRQRHTERRAQPPVSKCPRRLFKCRIKPLECALYSEQNVRIAQKRKHQRRARKTVYVRQPFHSQGFEYLLQDAARPQHRYEQERAHEGRHHQRHRREHRPHATVGQVASRRKPGDRHCQEYRSPRYYEHEQRRSSDDVKRADTEQELPRLGCGPSAAYHQVGDREQHSEADEDRRDDDHRGRGPRRILPTPPGRCSPAGSASGDCPAEIKGLAFSSAISYSRIPNSRRRFCVSSKSARSAMSTSGLLISSIGVKRRLVLTPSTRGYS